MDALGRLEGVRAVRVQLQTNVVIISPEPDRELDLAAVPRAIRGAGFLPAEMSLRARGSFVASEGRVAFRIHGWRTALPVQTAGEVPQGEEELHAQVDYAGEGIVLVPLPGPSMAPSPPGVELRGS